jgi:hypothetical protein
VARGRTRNSTLLHVVSLFLPPHKRVPSVRLAPTLPSRLPFVPCTCTSPSLSVDDLPADNRRGVCDDADSNGSKRFLFQFVFLVSSCCLSLLASSRVFPTTNHLFAPQHALWLAYVHRRVFWLPLQGILWSGRIAGALAPEMSESSSDK